jgi:predicted porin
VSYAMLNDRSDGGLRNADGSARSDNDARQIGLGYVHDLSKRTAIYTNYARLTNKGQGNYVVSGGRAPLGGQKSTGIEFGVRHLF